MPGRGSIPHVFCWLSDREQAANKGAQLHSLSLSTSVVSPSIEGTDKMS